MLLNILLQIIKKTNEIHLTSVGSSMEPIIKEGDLLRVRQKNEYEVGDILVFIYKNNDIVAHRLLMIKNSRYFCKGDNSFRLEDIAKEQIVGAVFLDRDCHHNSAFIEDSYHINRVFRRNKYNIELTKKSPEYIAYHNKYIEQ